MYNPYQTAFAPYQPPYTQQNFQPNVSYPQQQQSAQPTQNADERIFVPNATAADAYLVAAGGFVRLWDSSRNVFYEKSADMSGRQFPMRIFEYKEYQPQETPATADYEARFRAIEEKLAMLEERKATGRPKKVEVSDNE